MMDTSAGTLPRYHLSGTFLHYH